MSKLNNKQRSQLKQLIFQSIGEASMCWTATPLGVFDSAEATKVGDTLFEDIIELVENQD